MKRRGRNQNGFTIIEVVLVLVIIGIIFSIAIPRFNRTKARLDLEVAARYLVSDIREWENQAVTQQKTFRFLLNTTTKIYRFKEGTAPSLKIRDISALVKTVSCTEGMNEFNLLPSGQTDEAGHITLISAYNDIKYVYVLNTTGRVRVSDILSPP